MSQGGAVQQKLNLFQYCQEKRDSCHCTNVLVCVCMHVYTHSQAFRYCKNSSSIFYVIADKSDTGGGGGGSCTVSVQPMYIPLKKRCFKLAPNTCLTGPGYGVKEKQITKEQKKVLSFLSMFINREQLNDIENSLLNFGL